MKQTQLSAAPDSRSLLSVIGQPPASGDDDIEVVRWVPGVLPELGLQLGFDPRSIRDLPGWLKYPVNATTGTVIQPAFDFLASMARSRGIRARETCNAYAYDLRSYFEFLALEQQPWDQAGQATLDAFVLHMACAETADDFDEPALTASDLLQSGGTPVANGSLGLSRSTIKRRVAALRSFYAHALPGAPPFAKHTGRNVGMRPQELVRPIPPEDLPEFLASLGPKPSQWKRLGSSRLWCCCAIALTAGLRRIEVCGLDVDQIRALRPDEREPDRLLPIMLRVTKGGHERPAMLPSSLVAELQIFIEGERSDAGPVDRSSAQPLFVNHRQAQRAPSCRLRPATLSYDFRNAMVATDLRRKNVAFRQGTGSSTRLHTFHDLRHTCACMLYLNSSDTNEPWIEVQNRLGHKFLKTTIDIYLRFVNELRERPTDIRQSLIDGILAA